VSTAVEKHPPVDVAAAADNDQQLWSVTTILSALDRPALTYWACEKTAVAAVNQSNTWRGMLADDHPDCDHTDAQACAAVKWLRDARWRKAPGEKSDTEMGTDVHAACEEYVLTGVRPDVSADVEPYLRQFEEWCQRAQPSYTAAEMTVFAPEYGFAGTMDAVLTVDGTSFAADYKTSKKPFDAKGNKKRCYPEIALQLAAYAHGSFAAAWRPRRFERLRRRYYLLAEHERQNAIPLPQMDAGLGIMITTEFCDAYVVDISERPYTAFLYCLEAFRWQVETSRTVVSSEPLELS
jgi:hypothetical protein